MKTKFCEYLTMYRRQRGYTQAEMAEKLEISRSTYTNYETGNRAPDFETLIQIGDILDCSLDELFGRDRGDAARYPDMVRETAPVYRTNTEYRAKPERRLAIGQQDFRAMREQNAYYVDKTHMIEEFLGSWYQVTLITRPRRFGKTLNMSMLAEFFDCTKNSGNIFAGTYISRSRAREEMNRQPVIFLSFLDVKADSADGMLAMLADVLQGEYGRYYPIIEKGNLPDLQKEMFFKNYATLRSRGITEEKKYCIKTAVKELCQLLNAQFGKKVYLLIDEYDTPFISANAGGYYSEIRDVLAGVFGTSIKGNASLGRAVLTGIQRIAKENIFSGLNNLSVCTVTDREYEDCFGFTEEETRELLEYCGVGFPEEVRLMYDGYRFGAAEVYNPWSVSCYAARKKADFYWVNTSENSILKDALAKQGPSFREEYNHLIEQGTVTVEAELAVAYYEKPGGASFWGLLINAGMLTVEEETDDGRYTVRVPNREVWRAFRELTAFCLQVEETEISRMLYALRDGRPEEFARIYQRILLELPSYHDLKDENSYHMMLLGMCAFMRKDYEVQSNRESGEGRCDILLYSRRQNLPGIILEFKYTREESEDLEALAQKALDQIREKNYDAGMHGGSWHFGLAHRGKKAAVRWEKL